MQPYIQFRKDRLRGSLSYKIEIKMNKVSTFQCEEDNKANPNTGVIRYRSGRDESSIVASNSRV